MGGSNGLHNGFWSDGWCKPGVFPGGDSGRHGIRRSCALDSPCWAILRHYGLLEGWASKIVFQGSPMTKNVQFGTTFWSSKEPREFFTSTHITPSRGAFSVSRVHAGGSWLKILFTGAGVKCLTETPEIYGFLPRSFIQN